MLTERMIHIWLAISTATSLVLILTLPDPDTGPPTDKWYWPGSIRFLYFGFVIPSISLFAWVVVIAAFSYFFP